MDPDKPGQGRGGPSRPTRGNWAPFRGGRGASQSSSGHPQQGAPPAPVDPFGGGGSERSEQDTGGHTVLPAAAELLRDAYARAGWPPAQENVPPQSSTPQTLQNPFASGAGHPQPPQATPGHPSRGTSHGAQPRRDTLALVRNSQGLPGLGISQVSSGRPQQAAPGPSGPRQQQPPPSTNPTPMGPPRVPARPAAQGTLLLGPAGAMGYVDNTLTPDARRNVASALYYRELETIMRDAPLIPAGTPVQVLEVFRNNDSPDQKEKGQKRPLPAGETMAPPAKHQAVASGSGAGPAVAEKVGDTAALPVTIDDDDDDNDAVETAAAKKDPWSDPDFRYEEEKNDKFRYHKIDDHASEWPSPSVGLRFDTDRFRRDFGWPTEDVRKVFAAEFAEGGKDLYADPLANQDAGLGRDLTETGWQLGRSDEKCALVSGLPCVEDVVFARLDNYCAGRGIAPGTCYWTAVATHLYGDARYWLRLKAEHLEHFARVLENRDHPRHELYKKLNEKWYEAAASRWPGEANPDGKRTKEIYVNLWQVLNLPGVYTPMAILDVTADLFGLYMVVYSYNQPREAGQAVGPYENKVYRTIARGAYNARHLGLIFTGGNHFQPIIPNDYVHWEFKFLRFTQAATAGFPSTGKADGIRHPWRSEFGQNEKGTGGQLAPAIVDHGFDEVFAAMAVGYPPPPELEGDEGGDNQGGDDAPSPGGNGGGGDEETSDAEDEEEEDEDEDEDSSDAGDKNDKGGKDDDDDDDDDIGGSRKPLPLNPPTTEDAFYNAPLRDPLPDPRPADTSAAEFPDNESGDDGEPAPGTYFPSKTAAVEESEESSTEAPPPPAPEENTTVKRGKHSSSRRELRKRIKGLKAELKEVQEAKEQAEQKFRDMQAAKEGLDAAMEEVNRYHQRQIQSLTYAADVARQERNAAVDAAIKERDVAIGEKDVALQESAELLEQLDSAPGQGEDVDAPEESAEPAPEQDKKKAAAKKSTKKAPAKNQTKKPAGSAATGRGKKKKTPEPADEEDEEDDGNAHEEPAPELDKKKAAAKKSTKKAPAKNQTKKPAASTATGRGKKRRKMREPAEEQEEEQEEQRPTKRGKAGAAEQTEAAAGNENVRPPAAEEPKKPTRVPPARTCKKRAG